MKWLAGWLAVLWMPGVGAAADAVLRPSDVAFMYEGSRETYEAYGATVLAWGGTPSARSLEAARGVKFFGSVGMVTEFGAFHRRFPERYEEALCRDVDGNPVKVPWLVDHQSKGVPYWWCCTRQPAFREFLRERVEQTIRAGAHGLHIDDHLGTAGGLWLGICFCDRCVAGFRAHLAGLADEERMRLGVTNAAAYDFRSEARSWRDAATNGASRRVTGHPLWREWEVFQCRSAAEVMRELHGLANEVAGRPVPMGANAGLLWPRHLSDYREIDLFTAETDHHAAARRVPDRPVFAYRLAEAMGRPYAATASGGDWAFIKEHGLPGLVRTWIALGYAAGQRLMAPHRQWCHTPEKGTHWYEGPAERFAPLYRFVRTNAAWLDGHATHADVAVLVPHGAFLENSARWFGIADRLAEANLSYRVIVAGDRIVDRALDAADLARALHLLVPETERLLPEDRRRVEERRGAPGVHGTLDEVLRAVRPSVRVVSGSGRLRVFPRVGTGTAVVHVLNTDYDAGRDDVVPAEGVTLEVDPRAWGWASVVGARVLGATSGEGAVPVPASGNRVTLPRLELWSLVELRPGP